jgi:hypothetical protein
MIGACRDRVVQRSRRRRRIQKPAVPERAAGRRRERRGGATIKLKATPTEFTGPKRLPPTHRRWLATPWIRNCCRALRGPSSLSLLACFLWSEMMLSARPEQPIKWNEFFPPLQIIQILLTQAPTPCVSFEFSR